jgi:hypothetical protein
MLRVLVGAVVAPTVAACTSRGRRPAAPAAPGSSEQEQQARARLIAHAVAREQALLALSTAAAGTSHVGRIAGAAARDHRAHLEALRLLLPSATDSASATPEATPGATPRPPRPGGNAVADAERAWSTELLALLPEAPADMRRLLASVAGAEASHAALLRGTA